MPVCPANTTQQEVINMTEKIVGVFASEHDASNAIQDLKDLGYRADDISVVDRARVNRGTITPSTG